MDPDAAVEYMIRALADGDMAKAQEVAHELVAWRLMGNFPPDMVTITVGRLETTMEVDPMLIALPLAEQWKDDSGEE
jgi:hypothetical protein